MKSINSYIIVNCWCLVLFNLIGLAPEAFGLAEIAYIRTRARDSPFAENSLKDFCHQLVIELLGDPQAPGSSLFTQAKCLSVKEKVSSTVSSYWLLDFVFWQNQTGVQIYYVIKGQAKWLASRSLPSITRRSIGGKSLIDIGSERKFIQKLISDIPFKSRIVGLKPGLNLLGSKFTQNDRHFFVGDPQLRNDIWDPNLVGELVAEGHSGDSRAYHFESYWGEQWSEDRPYVLISADANRLEDRSDHESDFFSSFRSSYLFQLPASKLIVQYGLPLLKSDDIVYKLHLFAMYGEIGSGMFKGFHWNWRLTPQVDRVNPQRGDINESFRSSQISIGWAQDISRLVRWSGILNDAEVVYNIGATDLDVRLADQLDSGRYVQSTFRTKNNINLGIEALTNMPVFDQLIRFRLSTSYSNYRLSFSRSDISMLSFDGGIEYYTALGDLAARGTQLDLIFFISYQELWFDRNESDDAATRINELNIFQSYIGLGAVFKP